MICVVHESWMVQSYVIFGDLRLMSEDFLIDRMREKSSCFGFRLEFGNGGKRDEDCCFYCFVKVINISAIQDQK